MEWSKQNGAVATVRRALFRLHSHALAYARATAPPAASLFILVMLKVQLDYIEHPALRIAQHREATHLRDVSGRNILAAAKRRSLLRGPITVINGDIDSPIGRHRAHLRLNVHYPADVIVAVNDLGIRRRTTVGLCLPTEELHVIIDGFGCVVRQ